MSGIAIILIVWAALVILSPIVLATLSSGVIAIPSPRATEWKYGYETSFVRAARFNGRMGWGIEFELPRHPNECDRGDMLEWLEEHGALILQCGGSPGAPIKTIVRDIHDRDSANAWMMKILPEFHAWIKANLS